MKLEVICTRRPNMFAVNNNLFNMVCLGELEKIMTEPNYKSTGQLKLFYPERFLNTLEQRALMSRLESVGYQEVYIVTHSVYILQCTHAENIRVAISEDEPQEGEFILTDNLNYMPSDAGLNVV